MRTYVLISGMDTRQRPDPGQFSDSDDSAQACANPGKRTVPGAPGDFPQSRQDHMRPRLLRVRVALAAVALVVCISSAALKIRYHRIRRRLGSSLYRLRSLLGPGPRRPQSLPQRTNRRPGRRPAEPGNGPGAAAQPAGSKRRAEERLVKPIGGLQDRRRHQIRRRLGSSARRIRRHLRSLLGPGPRRPQSPPQRTNRRPGRRPAEPGN
jgi:hypothetical protein